MTEDTYVDVVVGAEEEEEAGELEEEADEEEEDDDDASDSSFCLNSPSNDRCSIEGNDGRWNGRVHAEHAMFSDFNLLRSGSVNVSEVWVRNEMSWVSWKRRAHAGQRMTGDLLLSVCLFVHVLQT